MSSADKNIWVAAGDGDLSRVRELIEHHAISPNVPDSFTYTPMYASDPALSLGNPGIHVVFQRHAAASYGHSDILAYLISKGGNVNVADEDGDTPLYTVENIETARFLVDNGADLMWRNNQGLTPAASLEEDFPQVADFLYFLTGPHDTGEPENRSQEAASERLTSSLMNQLSDLAQNEPTGDESHRDEELRQAVGHVVESLVTGYTMTNGGSDSTTHTHSEQTDG